MSETKEHMSVNDYIEETYKEEWEAEKTLIGNSRWDQYESAYNTYYAEATSAYPIQYIYESMLMEQTELQNLYDEIHDVPPEDRIDISQDREEQERIFKEAERYQEIMASEGAAIRAFNMVAPSAGVDSETVRNAQANAVNKSVQTKNDSEVAGLEAAAAEKAAAAPEYLVRGAPLRCLHGSHMRYLDMKETHGVYHLDKPLIHSKDKKTDENIFSFGICSSPTCTLSETISLRRGADVDQKGNYLRAPDDQVLTGIACKPRIIELWKNTNKDVQIADNASPGMANAFGAATYSAVTNTSYLLCQEGGIIIPQSSGQLEYTSYYAEFFGYPFDDMYSEDGKFSDAFKNWCDLKKIPPYYPGDPKYTDWYQEMIKDAKNDKEKKQLYEDYLKNAYQIGLDNMSADERKKVEQMKSEFLNSNLLKDKQKSELEAKYSGLRVDYGYNDQKNIAGATPHEKEFYDYYEREMASYNAQIEAANAANWEALKADDDSFSGRKAVYDSLKEKNRLTKEKEDLHARYEQELGRYDGHLDDAEKELGQSVSDAYNGKKEEQ